MTCDEVRERLAEYLLGTLEGPELTDVRRHLRGCAACRAESAALDEGLATFSRAAHDVEPPQSLQRRVLGVLEEEWSSEEPRDTGRRPATRLAWTATFLIVAGSVTWGLTSKWTAERYEAKATQWNRFLTALGGEEVRVGTLRAVGTQPLEGNVVVYDSREGTSWALVLVRAPGQRGTATVALSDESRRIWLPELEFDDAGEAHTLLVTGSSLEQFQTVTITDGNGVVLATARVSGD